MSLYFFNRSITTVEVSTPEGNVLLHLPYGSERLLRNWTFSLLVSLVGVSQATEVLSKNHVIFANIPDEKFWKLAPRAYYTPSFYLANYLRTRWDSFRRFLVSIYQDRF